MRTPTRVRHIYDDGQVYMMTAKSPSRAQRQHGRHHHDAEKPDALARGMSLLREGGRIGSPRFPQGRRSARGSRRRGLLRGTDQCHGAGRAGASPGHRRAAHRQLRAAWRLRHHDGHCARRHPDRRRACAQWRDRCGRALGRGAWRRDRQRPRHDCHAGLRGHPFTCLECAAQEPAPVRSRIFPPQGRVRKTSHTNRLLSGEPAVPDRSLECRHYDGDQLCAQHAIARACGRRNPRYEGERVAWSLCLRWTRSTSAR